MIEAINEAKKAEALGEVPVGAIVVIEATGEVIGRGHNTREIDKNALGHAEINAINEACKTLGSWRLVGCSLYCTLEPCPMCAGAILMSKMQKLVFGAGDSKQGACGSVLNIVSNPAMEHQIEVYAGIKEDECRELIQNFFQKKR